MEVARTYRDNRTIFPCFLVRFKENSRGRIAFCRLSTDRLPDVCRRLNRTWNRVARFRSGIAARERSEKKGNAEKKRNAVPVNLRKRQRRSVRVTGLRVASCVLRVAGCGLRVMGYGLWVIVTGKEAKVHGIQYAINIRSFDVFNSNVVV